MRTTCLFGLVALVCVLKLGFMLFGPGDASTEQAVHARMQAENDQMRDRLHWMKDAEIWDFAKKELDHCAAEEEDHGDDQVGGGGCYDFANKIAELKTQKNSKLMQREGAVDLLVKHHMCAPPFFLRWVRCAVRAAAPPPNLYIM